MYINGLIFWGMFGMFVETLFTSLRYLITHRQVNLMGHTSVWMFPIYSLGLSYGFDFVMYLIEDDMTRYLTYPLWIWATELLVGIPTSNRGVKIWDYSYLPKWLHWRGIVSFIHYPLWVGLGIMVEMIK